MAQAVTRTITTRRARPLGRLALLVLMLAPGSALALVEPRLRDLADPVPAGGLIPYRITLEDQSAPGPVTPTCFNPPSECATFPVTCNNPPPSCVGNGAGGFVCSNAGNTGANCGVGSPAVADPTLCTQSASGICNGGPNIGMQCTVADGVLTTQCPGITFLCKRAFNENTYCGTATDPPAPSCVGDAQFGFFCRNAANEGASCSNSDGTDGDSSLCQASTIPQARPENGFCLSNPTGICSGGPNFGLPCDTPHGFPTVECPPNPSPPPPSNVLVELPIPPGTSFVDADNGGTSSGSLVSWTLPPQVLCGGVNQPVCPELNARLLIDLLVPEGTAFQNTATATDQDGFVISGPQLTTVARFLVQALVLAYPVNADARDRVIYRAKFGLLATESITPGNEEFRFNVSTAGGTIVEFVIPAGQLPESAINQWTYYPPVQGAPGLKNVRLKLIGPGQYSIRLRASQMTLPDLDSLNVTVTINIGDDTFTHPARMLVKRGGQRFVAARSTSTTLIVSPPTTTTTAYNPTTTSTSTSTSTSSTSTTTETTTSTSTTETSTSTSTSTTETSTSTSTTETSTSTTETSTSTTETSTTETSTTSSTETSTTETSTTTSTTATTLLPCGGLISPVCGFGECVTGTCVPGADGDPCFCETTTTTTETSTTSSTETSTSTTETSTTSSTETSTTETSTSTSTTETSTSSTETSTTETSTSTSTTETSTTETSTTSSTETSTTETSTSTSTTETSTSTSTTATTLLPCGGLISPVCGLGECVTGTCVPQADGDPCVCQTSTTTTETSTSTTETSTSTTETSTSTTETSTSTTETSTSTTETSTSTTETSTSTTETSTSTTETSTTETSTTSSTETSTTEPSTSTSTTETSTTTSTTATTLLPCGGLISPVCGLGECVTGTCVPQADGDPCVCQTPTTTTETSTSTTETSTSTTETSTSTTETSTSTTETSTSSTETSTSTTETSTSTTETSTTEPSTSTSTTETSTTTSTTATTLLPCGGLISPVCGLGECVTGTCVPQADGDPCVCQTSTSTTETSTSTTETSTSTTETSTSTTETSTSTTETSTSTTETSTSTTETSTSTSTTATTLVPCGSLTSPVCGGGECVTGTCVPQADGDPCACQ